MLREIKANPYICANFNLQKKSVRYKCIPFYSNLILVDTIFAIFRDIKAISELQPHNEATITFSSKLFCNDKRAIKAIGE
jgi:hypothetical protein